MEGNTQVKIEEPLISVIVPVYKVEAYLRECVDSIIVQTYRNVEIILVDDGSPDRCGEICDEYAERDSRVVVIHKPNGGLSDARNAGLDAMRGEYLMFVDSDDTLTNDAIEILIDLLRKTDAQLAIGSSDRLDENKNQLPSVDNNYQQIGIMNREEAIKDMFTHGCSAWARLYKREVHEGIFFPKGEINEDEAIVLAILDRCTRVVATNQVIYHYLCRSESITTNPFSKKKLIWQKHCKANCEFVQLRYPELIEYANMRYRGSLLWSITELAMVDDLADYQAEQTELMAELKHHKVKFDFIPFSLKRDKIRYLVLQYLGFSVYRSLLRFKRG